MIDPSAAYFEDASRTVQSYSQSIGGQATIADFVDKARQQAKGNWRTQYTAQEVVNYLKAGFSLVPTYDSALLRRTGTER